MNPKTQHPCRAALASVPSANATASNWHLVDIGEQNVHMLDQLDIAYMCATKLVREGFTVLSVHVEHHRPVVWIQTVHFAASSRCGDDPPPRPARHRKHHGRAARRLSGAVDREGALAVRALTVERIGTCELCGLTDHHLVDGVCPTCRPRCATIPATAPGVALPPPSLELSVSGNSGFIARSREAFAQLGAACVQQLGHAR